MATTLSQVIEQQQQAEALVEAEKVRAALLTSPPDGTKPYVLTRDFYDSGENLHREGSVLFFRPGEAPASAREVDPANLPMAENVNIPRVENFEARKEKAIASVEVTVDGQKVVSTDGTAPAPATATKEPTSPKK